MVDTRNNGVYEIQYGSAKYRRGTHKNEDVKLICKNWNLTYYGCEKDGTFKYSLSLSNVY